MLARPRVFGSIALALVALAVHHGSLNEWWSEDDPAVLLHAATSTPVQVLASPAAYQALSLSSFTPLVTLSFDTDLALAGMTPSFFYIHQLLALTGSAVLLFCLLSRVPGARSLSAAWLAAAGFLVSPIGTYAARTLMIRHYVEGLAFSLLTLLLADVRTDSRKLRATLTILGAVSYAAALMAKEVYGPLPLLIAWQHRVRGGSWKAVAKSMVPYALVVLGFAAWRSRMLGSFGGYATEASALSVLATSFSGIWTPLATIAMPEGSLPGAIACVLILMLAGIASRPRPALSFLLIATIVAIAPLTAAATEPQVRYAFIPVVLVFAGVGMAAMASARRELLAILAILCVVALLAGLSYGGRLERQRQQQYVEGRYIWSGPAAGPILWGMSSSWYLGGLSEVRLRLREEESPRYILSPEGVLASGESVSAFVAAVPSSDDVKPVEPHRVKTLEAHRGNYSPELPLQMELEVKGATMRWSIQPEGDLAWMVMPSYFPLKIEARGNRRIAGSEPFRIRRTLPDGRWTMSPELIVPAEGESIVWKRGE